MYNLLQCSRSFQLSLPFLDKIPKINPNILSAVWISTFSRQPWALRKISKILQCDPLISYEVDAIVLEMYCRVKLRKWAMLKTSVRSTSHCFIMWTEFLIISWDIQTSFPASFSLSKKNLKWFISLLRVSILTFCWLLDWMNSNSCRNSCFWIALVWHPLKKAWIITALLFCLLVSCGWY